MKRILFFSLLILFACDKKMHVDHHESAEYELIINGIKYHDNWHLITMDEKHIHLELTDSFSYFEALFNLNHLYPNPDVRFMRNNENITFSKFNKSLIMSSSINATYFEGHFYGTISNGVDTLNVIGFIKCPKN